MRSPDRRGHAGHDPTWGWEWGAFPPGAGNAFPRLDGRAASGLRWGALARSGRLRFPPRAARPDFFLHSEPIGHTPSAIDNDRPLCVCPKARADRSKQAPRLRWPGRPFVPAYRAPRFRGLPGCGPSKPPQRTISWRMTCLAGLKKQSAYQWVMDAYSGKNRGNVKVSPGGGRPMAAYGRYCPTNGDNGGRGDQRAAAARVTTGVTGPAAKPEVTDW